MRNAYQAIVAATIFLSLQLTIGIWHLGSNSMIACGFFGAFFIFLAAIPSKKQVAFAMSVGFVFALIYTLCGGKFSHEGSTSLLLCLGGFVGAGCIFIMSVEPRRFALPLRDALVLPVFSLVAGLAMQFTNGAPHASYDLMLYRFDSIMGFSGRSVVMMFREFPWIGSTASSVYKSLLIFPPLFHAWASWKGKAKINLMHAFVAAGITGFLFYKICPAIGPLYAFGSAFPDAMPDHQQATVLLTTGVNNAMPSMHMTWALLVLVSAFEIGGFLAPTIASVFVLFTALATVGFGEHYLIDLIVSVPLVLLVRGIVSKRPVKVFVGASLVIAWTLLLRFGVPLSAPTEWALIGATALIVASASFSWTVDRLSPDAALMSARATHPLHVKELNQG